MMSTKAQRQRAFPLNLQGHKWWKKRAKVQQVSQSWFLFRYVLTVCIWQHRSRQSTILFESIVWHFGICAHSLWSWNWDKKTYTLLEPTDASSLTYSPLYAQWHVGQQQRISTPVWSVQESIIPCRCGSGVLGSTTSSFSLWRPVWVMLFCSIHFHRPLMVAALSCLHWPSRHWLEMVWLIRLSKSVQMYHQPSTN